MCLMLKSTSSYSSRLNSCIINITKYEKSIAERLKCKKKASPLYDRLFGSIVQQLKFSFKQLHGI